MKYVSRQRPAMAIVSQRTLFEGRLYNRFPDEAVDRFLAIPVVDEALDAWFGFVHMIEQKLGIVR